jgi:predicted metal-dependent enzyme (double-stranded beta helix superfamily)
MAKDNLKNIKMIMAMTITNDESAEVTILRALKAVDEDLDEVQEWLGTDFEAEDEKHKRTFQAIVSEHLVLSAQRSRSNGSPQVHRMAWVRRTFCYNTRRNLEAPS